MIRFSRCELRTTDVDAARAFYDAVLGARPRAIVPLPPELRARGVPAHWVAHLGTDDADGVADRLAAQGAVRVGPVRRDEAGRATAFVREPGGALLALSPPADPPAEVVWHELDSKAPARTAACLSTALGWRFGAPIDLDMPGDHRTFAWDGAPAGTLFDCSALAAVQPQWVLRFGTDALEAALQAVRRAGGLVLAQATSPDGARVAMCDDPQGAGFALHEG